EPPAGPRERSHPPAQRVVVGQRDRGTVKADGRSVDRNGFKDLDQEVLVCRGIINDHVALLQDRLTDVREVAAELHPCEAAERVVRLRERIPDHETLDLLRDDERVRDVFAQSYY